VQLLVDVDDVEETVLAAEALGGRLLTPATVLPGGDEIAVLNDPHRMPIAVRRRAAR
jgi:predicted enzyme related to lactoylglutathione lyase